MGLHSPLSPRQKIFFSQWPMDARGFEPELSSLNQSDSSSTSAQQYVAHEDVQIVPTRCPESKKEEELTNCTVTREISKLRGEGRSALQHTSCFTEGQCLRTPCFSDSLATPSLLAAASPLCLSAGSLSPILLLSPLKKSSGVDLSMYLPENYTPATTEALESSFDGRMFQFPAVSSRESPSFEMDVDTQESEWQNLATDGVGKSARIEVAPAGPSCQAASKLEMDFGNSLGQTEIEFSRLFFDCSSKWTSTDMEYESSDEDTDNTTRNPFAKIEGNHRELDGVVENSVEFPQRAKAVKAAERGKEISVSTRNKLERDRRKNMNSKLEKLRQIVPEVSQNKRASKVMILNKAAEYVKELSVTESTLFDRKAAEKARNEKLVRKLVQLTSNMKCMT